MSEITASIANEALSDAFASARHDIAKLEMSEAVWDEICRITSHAEAMYRFAKPDNGYCEHGTYVGGVMEDFMCGYCEQGD
jgi:hypothetical protein